jgi:hypothetical protein
VLLTRELHDCGPAVATGVTTNIAHSIATVMLIRIDFPSMIPPVNER